MKCAMITGGTNENTLCLEHHFGQKAEITLYISLVNLETFL